MPRKYKVADFEKALIIAKADVTIDETAHSTDHLFGCGLSDFEPVEVSIESVARFIRWQAAYMDGTWDEEEIENCKYIAKRKFLLK